MNKNYCMPTEDVKLLRRNLRACLQEVTSSFRLFKLARSALQIMKYFSHRHKLQRIDAELNGAACFKIFQVKLNPILGLHLPLARNSFYSNSARAFVVLAYVCNELFVGNLIWGVPYMPCGTKLYSNKNATLTPDNLDYIYIYNELVSTCIHRRKFILRYNRTCESQRL